jgi:hypothetical protein
MFGRRGKNMKKLLVCLMMCIMVSVATVKIEGVSLVEGDYKGQDLFVVTVGDDTESIYIIMENGAVLDRKILTEKEVQEYLKKPMSYKQEI